MNITYRIPKFSELDKVSEQIHNSYTFTYKGLMEEEYLSSLHTNHWVPILQECMDKGDCCLVAEIDDKIVGSTVFGIISEEKTIFAEWHAFYLLPQYIGHGIGHSFYQRIENEMRAQGSEFCILEVLSSNMRAIRFYQSHGFVKTESLVVEENGMTLSCEKMKADLHDLKVKSKDTER